ncbi:MAG: tetratricopeptide repeat protein [Kibdelosporangium sp.]
MKVFLALLAAAMVVITVTSLTQPNSPQAAAEPGDRQSRLSQLQQRLRQVPADVDGWARLGESYVELARVTGDPAYYGKAQGALDRSLRLKPAGNGPAMLGMGALANARHDFTAARDWAVRAQSVQPDTAEVYGVLADALTQLGDDQGAADAVQRMLDLRPSVAAFTRASYHFELHGRQAEAVEAMQRALESTEAPEDVAFCRYHLGELALNAGNLDEAAEQYDLGLAAIPEDPALQQGRAKVAAARGDLHQAVAAYRDLVRRAPQYLPDFAQLLTSAGRPAEAGEQYAIVAQQQRLLESQGATDDLAAALVAADRGDKDEALRRAEAEWSRRQSVFVADTLAWALHLNGRNTEALAYAEKADALGWRNATFAYHRGMILASLDRTTEARQFLAEAIGMNPYFPDAANAAVLLGGGR